jgi:hypothetical protein
VDPASTSFVLGYHGCVRALADNIFAAKAPLKPSHNDYEWLGDGARRTPDEPVERQNAKAAKKKRPGTKSRLRLLKNS